MSEVKVEYSEAQFKKAAEIIQSLPKDGPVKPTPDDQLFFYKYYKQANVGNNNTKRPGMLDFTGKAKWDAWDSVKDIKSEEAWTKYVAKLLEILKAAVAKDDDDEESKKYIAQIEAA